MSSDPTEALDLSLALEFGLQVARVGGEIALSHYRRDPAQELKGDGTWVTEADRAVETEIRARISKAWPDHNVLGEEEGLKSAAGGPARAKAPTWVIDPIDGTNNYIAGIPVWGTLVALRIGGESVVGVCHAPALGETYEGGRGLGARMNDEPIEVDPLDDLAEATVLFASAQSFVNTSLQSFFDEIVSRSWRTRGYGDFWGHMLVARGAAHVMVEPELSVWDVAALQPIVGEAGGTTTHLNGEEWREGGSCLTTNGALHEEVVTLASQTSRGPDG
ncbi:MAG: inositol monophosphatase family protein [Actinomycetota bacterium]